MTASSILPSVPAGTNKGISSIGGRLYAVDRQGNLGRWTGSEWIAQSCSMNLRQLCLNKGIDSGFVVTSNNQLGKIQINDDNSTTIQPCGNLGSWEIYSIAFDANNTLWCVNTEGKVGKWETYYWKDYGLLGGKQLAYIDFHMLSTGQILRGLDTNGNISTWETVNNATVWSANWAPNGTGAPTAFMSITGDFEGFRQVRNGGAIFTTLPNGNAYITGQNIQFNGTLGEWVIQSLGVF
jgi:hypothetical protein